MNPVRVRDIVIGEGIPKICVPLTGVTREELIKEAEELEDVPLDMVEWRADWYENAWDIRKVRETAGELRKVLKTLPLLFTFRTAGEGGEKEIDTKAYCRLNKELAASGDIDLIDVEMFTGDEYVKDMIREAHRRHVKVIVSNHDFEKTPEKQELVERFKKMQSLGADILKLAVMPKSGEDVLTLLSAAEEMNRSYADRPIAAMAMSGIGVISRLCGEVFGSAITFGAVKKASAPGQMQAEDLRRVLELLHKSL